MHVMDLKSTTLIPKLKKRQFYYHEKTLRHMDPLFKQHDIWTQRGSLPTQIKSMKKKIYESKKRKKVELVITDKSKVNCTEKINEKCVIPNKVRLKLKPISHSVDIPNFIPNFRSYSNSPNNFIQALVFPQTNTLTMDAHTST